MTNSIYNEPLEIRDHRVPGWFWLDNEIVDLWGYELGVYGFAVYGLLARHANNRSQQAFPSLARMAALIHTGKHQVLHALRKLENLGLVEVTRREGRSNLYTLLAVKSPTGALEAPVGNLPVSEQHHPVPQKHPPGAAPAPEQDSLTRLKEQQQQPVVVFSQPAVEKALSALLDIGVESHTTQRLIENFTPQRIMEVVSSARVNPSIRSLPAYVVAALDKSYDILRTPEEHKHNTRYKSQVANCAYRRNPTMGNCRSIRDDVVAFPWCELCEVWRAHPSSNTREPEG